MAALVDLFDATGGPDPNSPALIEIEPSPEFMQTFSTAQYTGANGSGPILNANAILVPNISDIYRDTANSNDFRLNNGLGVSRAFRKPDSQGGQTDGGFQGLPYPTKNFGRDARSPDLAWRRDDMMERARMGLKKMGFKPDEVPPDSNYFPWQWNDLQALGIGGMGFQYNRNYQPPDADAVARRLYEPTPSRRTKLITTDVEEAALRPNRTAYHPMKVVSEDRTREMEQRIPRNTDVIESVVYEKIFPRGMGPGNNQEAPYIFADPSVLRIPVGNNETGDRSYIRPWGNPHDLNEGAAMLSSTMEDLLVMQKSDNKYVRGQDIDEELRQYATSEMYLNSRMVPDPNEINPYPGEFPRGQSGTSAPLVPYPSAGVAI
jgi:hypothetical protein